MHECPQCESCAAALDGSAKVGFGPEADSDTKGGNLPFAADANMQANFDKADLRILCADGRSTNGSFAGRFQQPDPVHPVPLAIIYTY